MKQYLVEVPDEAKIVESTNTLIFDAAPATERTCKRVKGMTLYTEANVKTIAEESLKRGHEEAWELARKIAVHPDDGGYSMRDLHRIFNCFGTVSWVFNDNTYNEAAQKVKTWEEEKKAFHNNTYNEAAQKVKTWEEEKKAFHVGDIVMDAIGNKSVITRVVGSVCTAMSAEGFIGFYTQSELIKTGKTADISAILDQIKEA